jgi:hypothetical protein
MDLHCESILLNQVKEESDRGLIAEAVDHQFDPGKTARGGDLA